ncbi:MAG: hypothetical protein IJH87_00030, partial [Atopobiaceae bacterium]|nr:hypothetical protein [Atopobiaceae bacterium]
MSDRRRSGGKVFAPYHPAVAVLFFCAAVVFTMLAINPACAAASLIGAIACSLLIRGCRATRDTLLQLLPFWLLVALINAFYSSSQARTAWELGPLRFGFESLAFGTCAGAMLCAVVLWLASASESLSSDAALSLASGGMPVISLMLSQVMRLVPTMLSRGRDILDTQAVALGSSPDPRGSLRAASALMGWSMEEGAIRTASMRARGYGTGVRSSYRTRGFDADDIVLLIAVCVIGAAACCCAALVGS